MVASPRVRRAKALPHHHHFWLSGPKVVDGRARGRWWPKAVAFRIPSAHPADAAWPLRARHFFHRLIGLGGSVTNVLPVESSCAARTAAGDLPSKLVVELAVSAVIDVTWGRHGHSLRASTFSFFLLSEPVNPAL